VDARRAAANLRRDVKREVGLGVDAVGDQRGKKPANQGVDLCRVRPDTDVPVADDEGARGRPT